MAKISTSGYLLICNIEAVRAFYSFEYLLRFLADKLGSRTRRLISFTLHIVEFALHMVAIRLQATAFDRKIVPIALQSTPYTCTQPLTLADV